jgi:hypothetical protein
MESLMPAILKNRTKADTRISPRRWEEPQKTSSRTGNIGVGSATRGRIERLVGVLFHECAQVGG